jgi:hypothetical protein
MDAPTATLIAAGVAATASLVTLAVNVLGARRSEMRAAHRAALLPQLADIAEGLHGVMATSTVLRTRATKQQDTQPWIRRGAIAADLLKAVRPKIRYTLYGLDEPIRVLSRGPEWIATYRDADPGGAESLLAATRTLERRVSTIIRRSYRRGLPAGWMSRWRVSRLSTKARAVWASRFKEPPPPRWRFRKSSKYWAEVRSRQDLDAGPVASQ